MGTLVWLNCKFVTGKTNLNAQSEICFPSWFTIGAVGKHTNTQGILKSVSKYLAIAFSQNKFELFSTWRCLFIQLLRVAPLHPVPLSGHFISIPELEVLSSLDLDTAFLADVSPYVSSVLL